MALTATATKTLQRKMAGILGMYKPILISVSPCKKNIMYGIATSYSSIEHTFQPLLTHLRKERVTVPELMVALLSLRRF